mmetsp:Transcript_21492/g.40129  ORF Transcript_21492/g.40129 Transcript_21492/m.40129 type:complete len:348 (+) Transcript_21492:79-1122(+)
MFIQFVAQNKRRCYTGGTEKEENLLHAFAPQAALFQHVAVKRVNGRMNSSSVVYRLSSHEDADVDGTVTRFICRFSNGEETLSVFNFSYEWATRRRRYREMFHEHGQDNNKIFTSQLLFKCPVPLSLIDLVRTGSTVKNDYATIFVDLVPIRTPPRYGPPQEFLPPYYGDFQLTPGDDKAFDPAVEWGDNHILPKIKDSGRWENIPICKPTPLTYGEQQGGSQALTVEKLSQHHKLGNQYRLVSCLWASTGYSTRGNKFSINDGQRRLLEWIAYHKLIGIEHFYLYDNSGAISANESLHSIASLFPDDVTYINWPSKICNNDKDSVGERSSQVSAVKLVVLEQDARV